MIGQEAGNSVYQRFDRLFALYLLFTHCFCRLSLQHLNADILRASFQDLSA
jgi:hypothetical protein